MSTAVEVLGCSETTLFVTVGLHAACLSIALIGTFRRHLTELIL